MSLGKTFPSDISLGKHWRGTGPSTGRFFWSFNDSKLFFGTFNDSKLFSRINTSKLFSRTFKKCRVCKLQALDWKATDTQATLEMYMHSEKHTIDSTALIHELYNDLGKFSLEWWWFAVQQLRIEEFASDPQSVRLGLASDGFNLFSTMGTSHSTWPVLLIPYNLPPWICMKRQSFILSSIIPEEKAPGNDIDACPRSDGQLSLDRATVKGVRRTLTRDILYQMEAVVVKEFQEANSEWK
nr:hypothetical protein [Tanacetum cinerariifolium]